MPQPNLLFVFSDQHRACEMGCYGEPAVETPHFDRFARESRRFTRCLSNNPLCVPVRGSLLTGLFPWHHRALTNDLPIRPDARSIAHVLGERGWRTGYIGKWHLGGIPRDKAIPGPERLGFQAWKAYNCNHRYSKGFYFDETNERHEMPQHAAITETDLAIDYLHENRGRPWSLHLSWEPPHDPYQDVPAPYRARYDAARIALRPNVHFPVIASSKRALDEKAIRENLAGYRALITLLDEQFGRLLAALDETGQRENTLIVYTSDHGDLLGSHGFCNKQMPQSESVGVPLIVSGPGVAPGVSDALISLTDLPVTLASMLGCPWGAPTDGDDLRELLRDPSAPGPEARLIFDLVPVHQLAARGGHEWMGVVTRDATWAMKSDGSDWVHYVDRADPFQLENLVESGKASAERGALRSRMAAELARSGYRFRPWERMIREDGFLSEWNRSQAHFGLPLLAP